MIKIIKKYSLLFNAFVCNICRTILTLLSVITLMACGEASVDSTFAPEGVDESVLLAQTIPESEPVPETETETEVEPQSEPDTQSEPLVTNVPFTASTEDVTDLVLVTGQSNALGGGTSFDEFLDAPNNRVMAFTDNGWEIASLNQVWDLNWYPRTDPNTPPSNNFALHFGKRVASQATDRIVGIILLTAPGQPISHWSRDSEFFNQTRDKVSRAINELPYKSKLDAILWHQGESDGQDRDEYGEALYDLIERFRSEPWFDDNQPFICGETANSPVNRQLVRLNSDDDEWTSCVAAEGLPTLPNTNHFNAESLRALGTRYGDAYLEMWLGQ